MQLTIQPAAIRQRRLAHTNYRMSGIRMFLHVARLLSIIFTPLYLPIVGMVALYAFSYLSLLPWQYKMQTLVATYLFTILLPGFCIKAYRHYHGWTLWHLRERGRRMVPYLISICSFFCCYYLMQMFHVPHFITAIIVASLFVQIVCAMTNPWLKMSTHTAAIGGMTGGLVAFSLIFGFNAVWWLAFLIILAGLVGTARMVLRIHTLSEICTGYLIGLITTFVVILLI